MTATNTPAGLADAMKAINDSASQTGITAKLNANSDGLVLTNDGGKDINVANAAASAGNITLASQDAGQTLSSGTLTFTAATTAGTGVTVASRGTVEYSSDKGYTVAGTTDHDGRHLGSSLHPEGGEHDRRVHGRWRHPGPEDHRLGPCGGERPARQLRRLAVPLRDEHRQPEHLVREHVRIPQPHPGCRLRSETANLSRAQILQQDGTAMVAQANQIPQGVLSLLK